MTTLLRGHAADAALRLLPSTTQRQVRLIARMLDIPLHRAVRLLVHVHHGDIDALRAASIDRLVAHARTGQLRRGPGLRTWQQMVDGKDDAAAAETVVEGLLIAHDTPFATYREDVGLMLDRSAQRHVRRPCGVPPVAQAAQEGTTTQQVDAVRRRLVECVHRQWIEQVKASTGWPHDGIVDTLLAGHCDKLRLHDAFEEFAKSDNLNPFTEPPVHVRFLKFLQR